MTLDEAIRYAEEVAEYDCYNDEQKKCADEHRQLAEWLRELKRLRESATDADTISRQKTIDLINRAVTKEAARWGVEELPSAQPEIIRCKDCKWKNRHNCTRAVEVFIDDDKYCAWAERRTDD